MIRPTRSLTIALAIVGLAGLGACSDGGSDEDDVAAPSDQADTAVAEAVDCDGIQGETVTVDIGDFLFEPAVVEIATCDQIVWTNAHDQPHTSTGNGAVSWSTGNIAVGASAD